MEVHGSDAEKECSVAIRMPSNYNGGRSKLVVTLVAQSLLVVICLLISFHSWYTVHSVEKEKDSGIFIEWTPHDGFDPSWNQNFELNGSTLIIPCSGAYMVYVSASVCEEKQLGNNNTLSLLHGNKVVESFHIQTSDSCPSKVEERQHRIHYFNKNDNVSLSFPKPERRFKMDRLQLVVYYIFGNQCID